MDNSPALATAALQRGQQLEALGTPEHLEQALRAFEESIARWEALARPPEPAADAFHHLGIAWMNRGNVLQRQGTPASLDAARESYERTITCLEQSNPQQNPSIANSLGAAWMNRGLSLHRLATPEAIAEAERSHRQAIAVLSTLPLDENPWYRANLTASWLNLANSLLDTRPVGRFADARVAALSGLPLIEPFEKTDLAAADLSLKCRRAWCDAVGQMLALPSYISARADLAVEASDAVDDALALVRYWQAQDPRLSSEIAIRFYRFGAQLYRFHQPHFLAEFLLENIPTAPPHLLEEFRAIATDALSAAMTDLQPRQFLSLENPAHARLLETWRELQSARKEIEVFVLPELAATEATDGV